MPHSLAAKVNEAMFRGVKLAPSTKEPTRLELEEEFGTDELEKIDELPPMEGIERIKELKQRYPKENTQIDGLSMENIEAANLCKVEGMLVTLDGKAPTREAVGALPEEDFQYVLGQIEALTDPVRKKK